MPRPRLELHEILCDILGSRNCYFSPPASLHMKFPCIRYDITAFDTDKADNINYRLSNRYTLTYIDKDVDSDTPYQLLQLPYCSLDRTYAIDNMKHWVFTLYY